MVLPDESKKQCRNELKGIKYNIFQCVWLVLDQIVIRMNIFLTVLLIVPVMCGLLEVLTGDLVRLKLPIDLEQGKEQ